jgi:hypothetical protein
MRGTVSKKKAALAGIEINRACYTKRQLCAAKTLVFTQKNQFPVRPETNLDFH